MGNTEFFRQTADLKTNFKWREIFSEMFKNHTDEQKEKILVSGCREFMPSEARMLKEWQRPYMFFRFGVVGLIFFAIMVLAFFLTGAYAFWAMLLVAPAFIMPVTILLFFWEMNVPKNISLVELIKYVMYAGMFSIFLTFGVRKIFGIGPEAAAYIGGPLPEEIAKFILVYLIIKKLDCKYILNGLLIGCAVGVGFAAQESAGYAYQSLQEGGVLSMLASLIVRLILSIGGHAVYSSLYGAALAYEKKEEPLKLAHITTKTVILSWLMAFGLHFVWNFPVSSLFETNDGFADYIEYVKYAVLIVLAWMC